MSQKQDIIDGMARALWVAPYADYADEANDPENFPRAGSGEDWVDVAPETPAGAHKAAKELAALFEDENDCSLADLYKKAIDADRSRKGKRVIRSSAEDDFGFSLAMQAMGHGVSWFDDHATFPIKFPHIEVWFDGDHLEWWGGRLNKNPPKRAKKNPDDEDGEGEPDEEDITTPDHVKFFQNRRLVVEVPDGDDWEPHVIKFMEESNFFPNVWFISDHGNSVLLDPYGKPPKARRRKSGHRRNPGDPAVVDRMNKRHADEARAKSSAPARNPSAPSSRNREGLTLMEWVRAAHHGTSLGEEFTPKERKAWFDGEDPTEWAAHYSGVRGNPVPKRGSGIGQGRHEIVIVNASDKSWTRHRYVLWFGAYGDTRLLVHANSLDDALDEAIDWLAEHEPGHLANDAVGDEYKRGIKEGMSKEEAQEAAMVDTTSSGNGDYINSWEWGILAEDPTREQLLTLADVKIPKKSRP